MQSTGLQLPAVNIGSPGGDFLGLHHEHEERSSSSPSKCHKQLEQALKLRGYNMPKDITCTNGMVYGLFLRNIAISDVEAKGCPLCSHDTIYVDWLAALAQEQPLTPMPVPIAMWVSGCGS